MVRAPCCEKTGLNKGPWTVEEDRILINFITQNGHPNWRALPKRAGTTQYLSPSILPYLLVIKTSSTNYPIKKRALLTGFWISFFRIVEVWKELSSPVDELLAARYSKGEFYKRRRGYNHSTACPIGK